MGRQVTRRPATRAVPSSEDLDLDPLIRQVAQRIARGEIPGGADYMADVRGVGTVSWTGVSGVTQTRPVANRDVWDFHGQVPSSVMVSGGVEPDPSTPWCSCRIGRHGFGFDPQIGVFVHIAPDCWRPSKGYYEAARQAGVLEAERGSSGEEGPSQGGHRQPVQPSSADGRNGDAVRRRPRTPRTPRAEVREEPAGQSGEESGADQVGGGDVLGERSNRTPRRARRSRDTTALWSDKY